MVTWVLEVNLIAESLLVRMKQHLQDKDIRFHEMTFVPFIYEPIGERPQVDGPCVVYGAAGVAEWAAKQRWKPGVWNSPHFAPQNYGERLGNLYLNRDQVICRLSEVEALSVRHGWERFFLRPNDDNKQFAGGPTSRGDVAAWVEKLKREGLMGTNDILVAVAPLRDLGREWRTIVVNKRPIAWSQYRRYGRRWDDPSIELEALKAVQAAVEKFAPIDVFAADVCESSDGMKVIEYNTFNSAGLYACDVGHVIDCINEFVLG
ncbi:MAG: ATP-grasp domain-containing protein [Aestuariivirga sp.]